MTSTQPIIYVDGTTLSLKEILMVSKQPATVQVSADALPNIPSARRVVERIVDSGETVYGINTGFGALVS